MAAARLAVTRFQEESLIMYTDIDETKSDDVIVVSVVIPAYNAEKTITRAVESALNVLDGLRSEVIVVDDGSTDSTADKVALLGNNEELRIVRQNNAGRAAARNRGVSLARGRWIMFLDADDMLLPGAAEILAYEAETSDSDLIVFPMIKGGASQPKIDSGHNGEESVEIIDVRAADLLDAMIETDGLPSELTSAQCEYEANASWSRLYKREHVLSLIALNIPGFEPFPIGLRFSEDRLLNLAYLARDRNTMVSFVQATPLYYWDISSSGTVLVSKPDDCLGLPLFAKHAWSLCVAGLMNEDERNLVVAREAANELKRAARLPRAEDLDLAEAVWHTCLSDPCLNEALLDVQQPLRGTGFTWRWSPMTKALLSSRFDQAFLYCRFMWKMRALKLRLLHK